MCLKSSTLSNKQFAETKTKLKLTSISEGQKVDFDFVSFDQALTFNFNVNSDNELS